MPGIVGNRNDFDQFVPSDKKLSQSWIDSLTQRGQPTIYRGDELKYIGMPIGGIGAGQVYISGDGRLWHWDIFNQHFGTGADHYAHPMPIDFPFDIGFKIEVDCDNRSIDSYGFKKIEFRGEYPIAKVEYSEDQFPVTVKLEAFSPFIPLNTEDSSLPATVLNYTITNRANEEKTVSLVAHLENAVGLLYRDRHAQRSNQIIRDNDCTLLECSARELPEPNTKPQEDIVFEDWDKETYEGWIVEGDAFGNVPILKTQIYDYLGEIGGDTQRVVNSHASAPGEIISDRDNALGKLTSSAFSIERNFIHLWVGGGNRKGTTCVNLMINGKVVQSLTGRNSNKMTIRSFDVRKLRGQQAQIEIVDNATGDWGNIGAGKIWFSDTSKHEVSFEESPDTGTMALALLGDAAEITSENQAVPYTEKLVGQLGRRIKLAAGQSTTVSFVVTWHFPNLKMDKLPGGRYYATRFAGAVDVARYVVREFNRLHQQTQLWRDTWYDSTLPYWFLDRTFVNASILASSTCYLFKDRRFYGWEGVGCCAGTCGHVWMYAQAVGRLFPDLERNLREVADFTIGMQPDGAILFRGEHNDIPAVDSQAGTILRSLREHQMSADNSFLVKNWNSIKRAMQWLIDKDGNEDGIIESNQHNTLDSDWYGANAWLSGLYLAALRAAEVMAIEMKDVAVAARCRKILDAGQKNLVAQLFDGEYFINQADPDHLDSINSGTGCHIDQIFGQSWAHQVNLGRILPEKETKSALASLWKYNFSPDVGPYRKINTPGRWYAMAGEAGLLICTFPRTDWDYEKAGGVGKGHKLFTGYFNECMNGFEYQVASHMIWEGMVTEGLAITRAIHDRYHASRRNPYNEIECGDHYARSMASYGVYLSACGFEYHGPAAHIGLSPRISADNFKAAFTSAEGWGTFSLTPSTATISIKWGKLKVRTISIPKSELKSAIVMINAIPVIAQNSENDGKLVVSLNEPEVLKTGDELSIKLS